MYLLVEENPNCTFEERMFSISGGKRIVQQVLIDRPGLGPVWCDVTGVDEGAAFVDAVAVHVDDSGAGLAWLIYGGSWGLRSRLAESKEEWALQNARQWGAPFLVFDVSGAAIRFRNASGA